MRVVTAAAYLVLASGSISAFGEDLVRAEQAVLARAMARVAPGRRLRTDQFRKVHQEVMAGTRKAYLIDVRSHPEFYAGHIEGTDHVPAGHLRKLTKLITDPNAEIVLWCRTHPRAYYGAAFLQDCGYRNVWVWHDGIAGWIEKGYPLVNQFMGRFTITDYDKDFGEVDPSGRPRWRLRISPPH